MENKATVTKTRNAQLKAGLLLLLAFFFNRGQDVQNRLFYKVKQIKLIPNEMRIISKVQKNYVFSVQS